MANFWTELPRPVFSLAPMEDVTDTVFRELVASVAAPERFHVLFTEFMNVDGFLHEKGRERVAERLIVSPGERKLLREKGFKLVAQIWGTDPQKFHDAIALIHEGYDFDGIDINMGCPVKKIVKKGACSALIQNPGLAREILAASKEASPLPVSVKTRIGIREVVTEDWVNHLLEAEPAAITIHGRTQRMMSEGQADWTQVRLAAELRDAAGKEQVLVMGNGDVMSHAEGMEKAEEFKADGIMIGRGIFANPAFFAATSDDRVEARMELLEKHIRRFDQVWKGRKNYNILKRFFKIYVHSFPGASELRAQLMDSTNGRQGLDLITAWKSAHSS